MEIGDRIFDESLGRQNVDVARVSQLKKRLPFDIGRLLARV